MLYVGRCVPSMDSKGDADATDGEPVADARPDAIVALSDTVCVSDSVSVAVADNVALCVGETEPHWDGDSVGDCDSDVVPDTVPHCDTEPVAVTEPVAHCDGETVCVALSDSDDVGVSETLTVSDVDA
jgi:hypothetical protein